MDEDARDLIEVQTAADAAGVESAEPGAGTEGADVDRGATGASGGRRTRAIVIAAVAAIAIALSAAGVALTGTTGSDEPGQPVAQEQEDDDEGDLDEAEVLETAAGLTFAGTDVSAPAGSDCSVDAGCVTLTSASGGDLAVEVPALARRAAALAAALEGRTVAGDDILDVTCVLAAFDGTPLMAVTCTPDSESARASSGAEDADLATLLAGSTGWAMSDEAYDAIGGEASGVSQSGGAVPTDAAGAQIVEAAPAADGSEGDPEGPQSDPADEPEGDSGASGQAAAQEPGDDGSGAASTSVDSGGTGGSSPQAAPGGGSGASDGGQAQQQPSKPAHTHSYDIPVYGDQVWVVEVPARDEPVYETVAKYGCTVCGQTFDTVEEWGVHDIEVHDLSSSYSVITESVQTGTTHVEEQGHYETPVVGYRCSCGAVQGQ